MTDQEKQSRIKVLDVITKQYETVIANYSLDETEDLNDEEYDDVIRAFWFSRGDKNWFVCMNIGGYIRAQSPGVPADLIVQMHNEYLSVLEDFVGDDLD